jgi:hypothetical protein
VNVGHERKNFTSKIGIIIIDLFARQPGILRLMMRAQRRKKKMTMTMTMTMKTKMMKNPRRRSQRMRQVMIKKASIGTKKDTESRFMTLRNRI